MEQNAQGSNVSSFNIDHTKLKSGLFVSRKDLLDSGLVLTTFDLRMKRPYHDEPMTTGSVHATEHLLADYLRSDDLWGNKILYVGPMGCRTGFYVMMSGDLNSKDVLPLMIRAFDYISDYDGGIPGATQKQCGNFRDMDLEQARNDAAMYYNVLIEAKKENLVYPVKREKKKTNKETV
ncbi:MAG TPA: S-ribosylhomocysteine lyase [Candidatus Stercoripulliclostridium merdigallinarum]|uniref:S-ribosylhomocysteine lyase n=1 Tax=Candidatus Stercoripulliclostridium merdigallinarum TaxID=2840951 RepID=A0A9D1SI90_9FIRM|nr:S-ribosylhomocysteine lyase [Candidatus Stercoripulliclostridium merdigallinarum]